MQLCKIISAQRICNKQQPSFSLIEEAINKFIAESLESTVLGESVFRICVVAYAELFRHFLVTKGYISFKNITSIRLEASSSGCSLITNIVCGYKIVVYTVVSI